MKVILKNLQLTYIFSLTLFIIVVFWGSAEFILAQNINPSFKKKSDFVSQDEKEFAKIKQLKVKSRTKYAVYYDMPNYPSDKKVLLTIESFNKTGLLTEIIEQNSSGNVISNYKFKYDSKGRPVKAEGQDDAGKSNTQTSRYDAKGNEIERRLISIGRRNYEAKSVMHYDKNGNVIEVINYENNKLSDRQKNTYVNNVRTRTDYINQNGDTLVVSFPEYDASGKLIKEERKAQNSSLAYIYKYDANGRLSEMIDPETKRIYSSDEKGNVIEHKMFLLDGRRQIRLVFKYNNNGLQSDQIRYDNNETVVLHTVYEYEYYK